MSPNLGSKRLKILENEEISIAFIGRRRHSVVFVRNSKALLRVRVGHITRIRWPVQGERYYMDQSIKRGLTRF